MAEIAAGAIAAEQVVSTGIYAGTGYTVARPTMPLKASFSQIATTSDDASRSSLARSHHTLTIVGKKAYIFGGRASGGKLAHNNIHSVALPVKGAPGPEYAVLPAIGASSGDPVPAPRSHHSACALGTQIAVYGGCDESGKPLNEGSRIWLYDTEKLTWTSMEPGSHPERAPTSRANGTLLAHDGNLIVYGGHDSQGSSLTDVWHFNSFTKVWNQLPHSPVAGASAAVIKDTLYLLAPTADKLATEIHHLDIKLYAEQPPTWDTFSVPTNPLTPGPKPRENGGLLPITTGFGRNYLLYFFGDRQESETEKGGLPQWSDLWTFQLPSDDVQVNATTTFSEAIKPAKIKDKIRETFGADSGKSSWAEVEVQAPGDVAAREGKAHPGPRSSFGYDVTEDGLNVVIWGGNNGRGEPEGDGWVIELT
ncbi:hypothetical protein F4778DRAFT_473525 [Xylariomycetidae sp. FL2044]|nr:hypothetical protein F4778DRAFT_473525 [Xylariomycetidae sp. FL2044]